LKSQTILTHFKTLEMNFKNRFYKQTAHSSFFSIDNFVVEYHDEIKKEKEANKPIDLKPTNWNKYKEIFYNQRIDKYKSKGFTKELIIGFELNKVKNLPNENEKYFALLPNESEKNAALKKYYTQLLNEKLKSEQSKIEQSTPEKTKKTIEFEDFFYDVTPEQLKQIKEKFKDLEPKETAIFIDLLYNDFKVLSIIHGSRKGKSQKDFIKHITDNSNQSINMLFSKDTIENYIYKGNEADKTTIKTQLETILK